MDKLIVRIEHTRRLKMCARGLRAFCARNGIDYVSFVRNGIPASELPKDDAVIAQVLEVAREQQ